MSYQKTHNAVEAALELGPFWEKHCGAAWGVHLRLASRVDFTQVAHTERHPVHVTEYFWINCGHVSSWILWTPNTVPLPHVVLEKCQRTWVRKPGLFEAPRGTICAAVTLTPQEQMGFTQCYQGDMTFTCLTFCQGIKCKGEEWRSKNSYS